MKPNVLILMMISSSTFTFSQVGVNTQNPQGAFTIDGAKNDPTIGVPSTVQQADDFVVTSQGNVGIGTTTPFSKLQISSGTDGVSGLKFDNVNNMTISSIGAALLGVDSSGNVVVAEGIPANAITGDIKNSVRVTDHNGWYLLDGRAVSTLPASAQTAATALGFTANIPDATDRLLKTKGVSETIGAIGGANTLSIAQTNLPNVNFTGTISGTAEDAGNHVHAAPGGNFLLGGVTWYNNGSGNYDGNGTGAAWGGIGAYGTTQWGGSHHHTISGTTSVNTGGNGTSLDNRSPYLVVNAFIYLGQ